MTTTGTLSEKAASRREAAAGARRRASDRRAQARATAERRDALVLEALAVIADLDARGHDGAADAYERLARGSAA